MSTSELTFRQAGIEEIYELRFAVLRPKLVPMKLHFVGDGEGPPLTWHVGAFEGGVNVGCLTLFMSEWERAPAYQLRGMAVAPARHRRGVGKGLLQAARELVDRDAGGKGLMWWCNARVEAIGFYERAGWEVVSEEFLIEHVGPHRRMVWRRA